MSIKTSSIIRNKKLPNFIKTHPIFKKSREIVKIFPLIGLPNCSAKISLKDSLVCAKEIRTWVSGQYYIDRANQLKIKNLPLEMFIGDIWSNLSKHGIDLDNIYTNYHGYINLHFRRNIKNVNALIQGNIKIEFSSDGSKGSWDIANISRNGIISCQGWSGQYKGNLIGSIVDPFCGIISLTKDNKKLYRCIVRYVISNDSGTPALLMETIYSNSLNEFCTDKFVENLFKDFLISKTDKKFRVITRRRRYKIPASKIVKDLRACGPRSWAKNNCLSYRDSGIAYSDKYKIAYKGIAPFNK